MSLSIENENLPSSMIRIPNGELWFLETGQLWPGQAMSLRVESILHQERSLFQDILVLQSTDYGRVLVLDGVIQITERDEFAYQEMISHLPLNAHPCPKKVLIIGGGDGAVLREILRHDSVESATQCEIDEAVVRLSKRFFPSLSESFTHPKVRLVIGDGFEFLKQCEEEYDVIITDSSDPVGPAESLFHVDFFKLLHNALKPDGIVCSQGESIWLQMDFIERLMQDIRGVFPVVKYASVSIPTYPCGQIGFILASKLSSCDLSNPIRGNLLNDKGLRYYNESIHHAAFVLPTFAQKLNLDK